MNLGSKKIVVCARVGGANTTHLSFVFLAAHFAKRNTKFGGGQFRSKNVRAELYNSTNVKLSDFCSTDSAARSAANLVGQIPESQLLVGNGGIEPPASVLSGLRSTIELIAQKFLFVRRAGQECPDLFRAKRG